MNVGFLWKSTAVFLEAGLWNSITTVWPQEQHVGYTLKEMLLHVEFPQDVTVWAAIGFDVFLLLKEHAGRYSFSGLRGVVAVVVHARARMASSNLGFFTIPSLFADTWNWLLSFVLMHLGYIWDIFGNCKDLSFLLLELIEKKFSLIVGAGVGS